MKARHVQGLLLALYLCLAAYGVSDSGSQARIDALFIKDIFENNSSALSSVDGLRKLYEESAAIDPDYWRVYHLKMRYEAMVSEDRSGMLRALDTARECWDRYASDPENLDALKQELVPDSRDLGSNEAWQAFFNRLRKQLDAIEILSTQANLHEAMDEPALARISLEALIESGNSLARYEALTRLYWLRIKYLTLKEAPPLFDELDQSILEIEADMAHSSSTDAPMTQFMKHQHHIGFLNERAILYGYVYDIGRCMEEYELTMEVDRGFYRDFGWDYGGNETLESNLQLTRLSDMDWEGLALNHRESASTYSYLQTSYEAFLSAGAPARARREAASSKADRRYYTEGMRRLFLGQSCLLAGDAKAAIRHLEYAAGYKEVFRDISYTLTNFRARVYSELICAYRAERSLQALEGKPAILSLPLRIKEFYYRFLLLNNLKANPDYLALFSPFMLVRDMSLSPYAAMEVASSLDQGILRRRLEEFLPLDQRQGAQKYYDLYRANIALSSGRPAEARGIMDATSIWMEDPSVIANERLYLAMAHETLSKLEGKNSAKRIKQALAAFRAYPGYAVGRGLPIIMLRPKIIDSSAREGAKLLRSRLAKAAKKWRLSWRESGDDLPQPVFEISAEGEGEQLRYRLSLSINDPGAQALGYSSDEDPRSLLIYPQDLKRGDYPSWALRALLGIRSEDEDEKEEDAPLDGIEALEEALEGS